MAAVKRGTIETLKKHFSPRTGCSFTTSYEHFPLAEKRKFYYKKLYHNYKIITDPSKFNKKTLKKQAARRERIERRIISDAKKNGQTEPSNRHTRLAWVQSCFRKRAQVSIHTPNCYKVVSHLLNPKHGKDENLKPYVPKGSTIKRRADRKPLLPPPSKEKPNLLINEKDREIANLNSGFDDDTVTVTSSVMINAPSFPENVDKDDTTGS
ncbi:hypothetical protein RCL_jg6988.t1 [Rhizophagus clarus]|uniref:DUF8211 domain-containing protein n=1 Tax=Rhizophagus clarus TaxID=94130 RepID=A0A8H3M5R9_9GLOM|nr:hypothetical protein RCL_jg6988.t1 [Rhizophagus clarus]